MLSRRQVLTTIAGLGVASPVLERAIVALAQDGNELNAELIGKAAFIAGLELTDEQKNEVANQYKSHLAGREAIRQIANDATIAPVTLFKPAAPTLSTPVDKLTAKAAEREVKRPASAEELAFSSLADLAHLVRTKQITSLELTELSLERLQKYDPLLKCVVTLTADLAREQAKNADAEISSGNYRGPLHGIPWGAKDLIAYPGYPTTWGIPQLKDQKLPYKATVAQRLEDAGAVLVAKLSLGAIAMGDQWFGGMTRCPWDAKLGSSGSSAGSASAVAAGLVPFAIGSETLGSIVSPCRRCGTTGLRPTFGRVSRYGCMPLSWTMDKLGPITRRVEDCALVFAAIAGTDGKEEIVQDAPFNYPHTKPLSEIKVGYVELTGRRGAEQQTEQIAILEKLGVKLVPITLPNDFPASALTMMLDAEAAAMFSDGLKKGETEGWNAWPGIFRKAHFYSAVDYIQASRARRVLIEKMKEAVANIDVYLNGNDLLITNLTGHPTVVMPYGFDERNGTRLPYSVTFTGQLFGEDILLTVAQAFQEQISAHRERPPLDKQLADLLMPKAEPAPEEKK